MERVVAYVDGFNLYFGLRDSKLQRCYWLNIQVLAQNLLLPDQELRYTKYFTARIAGPPAKQRRQNLFIEALETLPDFSIHYGKYQRNARICGHCGVSEDIPNEKMTDVNIAVELLTDAHQDAFDTALLISADSDLTAPVQAVHRLFPKKRVVIAFPPSRYSADLSKVAKAHFIIGAAKIRQSVFAPEVTKADGFVLKCPDSWK